ncbi:MAG: glycerophosphodiester phosphodiesterase [bacterium]|nr:glycerophosphodiester phosphodiesterase [bacterium]
MKLIKLLLLSILSAFIFAGCTTNNNHKTQVKKEQSMNNKPIIIAHRGASAYVPEHTLIAKVMAYAQGADYIEQDVSMTKDGKIVVMHDIFLDTNTNVKKKFPSKAEKDGKYHIVDFTLKEIKQLSVHERTDENGKAVFSDRFPETDALNLKVPTLEQEIILIQGLNKSTSHDRGLYIELKQPDKYKDNGHEFAKKVLEILSKYGYNSAESNCIIQCFDPDMLKYMKNTLHTKLRLIQLIGGSGTMYDKMCTKKGLEKVSEYAYGIGPSISRLFTNYGKSPDLKVNNVAKWAHEAGLKIHPYTLRKDELPKGLTYNEVCNYLFKKAKVDGMFTDYPDLGVEYIKNNFK